MDNAMTKKHYEALARILSSQMCDAEMETCQHTVRLITRDIADYLATENPRFDRSRFLKACGLESAS